MKLVKRLLSVEWLGWGRAGDVRWCYRVIFYMPKGVEVGGVDVTGKIFNLHHPTAAWPIPVYDGAGLDGVKV